MVIRFTDDSINNVSETDFKVRRRIPLITQILIIFAISYIAIFVTAYLMRENGIQWLFLTTLTVVMGALTWFTLYFFSHHRDLLLTTEFQNAILSSAVQLSTRFCFIVKRDGLIVYADRGFQSVFTQFIHSTGRTVYELIRTLGLPEDLQQTVAALLRENHSGRIILPITDSSGSSSPMMVTVEMLTRPSGYFLFRGRDYVENRNTLNQNNLAGQTALLAQSISNLHEAILIADSNDLINYVSPVLESWLGYGKAELLSGDKNLATILQHYTGKPAQQTAVDEFEGTASFLHKGGASVVFNIHQSNIYDNGTFLGISIIARRT